MKIFEDSISHLRRSNKDKRHPFNLFSLATVSNTDNMPQIRTLVNRRFDEDYKLFFYTDSRSQKLFELQDNPQAAALFYHARMKLQIRIKCRAEIPGARTKLYKEHKAIAEKLPSSDDYQTKLYPATPIHENEKIHYGQKLHFSLVTLVPYEFDILKLGKSGHQRYRFIHNSKSWVGQRLVP